MKTKGWQKIFTFTLIQHIKTKSFIIGTAVMALLVALMVVGVNIIPGLISGEENVIGSMGEPTDLTVLEAVYIRDEAALLTDEDMAALSANGVALADSDKSYAELIDELAASARQEVLVSLTPVEQEEIVIGYAVKCYYSPSADGDAVDGVSSLVAQLAELRNYSNLGVSAENLAFTQRYITTSKIEAGNDEWNVFESAINYFVPLVVSLLLFMMIFTYGNTVAQSIATEKTSRVMELLLTSVRPLAVVIGKVLAMGIVSVCQFILMGIVGSVSFAISAPFGIGGELMTMLENAEMQIGENAEIVEAFNNTLGTITPLTILIILVIFILGFLFFSLVAALVGASVSRMEDLQQAMQPYSLLGVVGCYLAYFPVIFNIESMESGAATVNPVQIFSYYCPISSPFALPSALLLGTLSMVEVIIAVLILAVMVALVAMLVAKVYEMIILHNGNLLKFKDIIAMAFRK